LLIFVLFSTDFYATTQQQLAMNRDRRRSGLDLDCCGRAAHANRESTKAIKKNKTWNQREE
jgi:hypothetical protein